MPVLEFKTENLTDWEDEELARTFGVAKGHLPNGSGNEALWQLGLQQPVVQVNLPQQPLSALNTAFLGGVSRTGCRADISTIH